MKIDLTKIEGYETMTAEEKLAVLEALDLPEPDMTGWVKKEVLDKATSEAAKYKREIRERMSAEEIEKAKAAENMANIMAELETLREEKAVGEYTTQFMGIGYDEALAKATAMALQKGDMQTMFKNHAKFVQARDKAVKAEMLKDTPTPPAGEGSKAFTKTDFEKLSLEEKAKFATEHPEQYKDFYGGN
jgi:uncharacterized protein with von Willebrand factor type A (vWA) domain